MNDRDRQHRTVEIGWWGASIAFIYVVAVVWLLEQALPALGGIVGVAVDIATLALFPAGVLGYRQLVHEIRQAADLPAFQVTARRSGDQSPGSDVVRLDNVLQPGAKFVVELLLLNEGTGITPWFQAKVIAPPGLRDCRLASTGGSNPENLASRQYDGSHPDGSPVVDLLSRGRETVFPGSPLLFAHILVQLSDTVPPSHPVVLRWQVVSDQTARAEGEISIFLKTPVVDT